MLSTTGSPFVLSFVLLLSLPVVFFILAPHILSPKTLPAIPTSDELDDLNLFRRATLSSSDFSLPPKNRPKIAFLFLTNSPLTFSPLWDRFFAGHDNLFNLYVHTDPTKPVPPPGGVFTAARFLARNKRTARASATLISAARRLLAAALIDDPSNAYFALLSQHCIPLHSFRFVYHSLFASDPYNSSFPRNRHLRYKSFIEILDGEPGLHDRYIARGDDVMMPEVPFSSFRVGSQFFVLTRRHALLVVRERRLWKKFRMPCLKSKEDSCYPEEHYFPTLLSMQDPNGCTHYTLTRVNWTDSVGGHPHTYSPDEISADLVRRLRVSNSTYSYLFARKFSPETLEPLMAIADTVIFRD
ncbi:hypothetical protein QJS10_CPB19g01310 [Acorus calamus]|uniref:Core-2/I-branching beta-1,6-N-acetylglucosaminyltransferase family protein n=1 Tax=Acorus calamus TaxID=4465 RepID=A0AAV9CE85_ACOCL|nr:hypothetical protein QJS10_CPB19g01310 [Acorus calamus]